MMHASSTGGGLAASSPTMMSALNSSHPYSGQSPTRQSHAHPAATPPEAALEMAGRTVEKMLFSDAKFPPLVDKLRAGGTGPSLSGNHDPDYPALGGVASLGGGLAGPALHSVNAPDSASLRQLSSLKHVPLPTELVEHFGHMRCNCMMGLFTEIDRAWLTIDNNIYVWRYEDCSDLAYFDGLSDTILSVALLKPKKDIFQAHIKYILCLTTPVEIILLGVSFAKVDGDEQAEMRLLPEPLYTLPTDAVYMMSIGGSHSGRIFLGGKDGCLYEFSYKADDGWFGKKAVKVNHSTSSLSFLVPSFVNAALYKEDPIVEITVDDSRNVLYTRSQNGVISLFDLGDDGKGLSLVSSVTTESIVAEASKVASHIDKSNLSPLVGISKVNVSESFHLALVAVTASGVRYYFGIVGNRVGQSSRPSNLTLQHVRVPPGFVGSSKTPRPNNVHRSYYGQGTLLLVCSQTDTTDVAWLLSSDGFPFQNVLMEGQSNIPLDGKVWAMDEVPGQERMLHLYKDSFQSMDPPLAVIQHTQAARKFVLMTSHGAHIISKLRPVDHLRQLLLENNGPDNDVIKAFFALHSETQAVATCLVLACSRALQDAQVAEWATRAFFLYGGEPRMSYQQQQAQQPPQPFSPSFHPHIASTPAPHNAPGSPGAQFTPRQDGNPFGSSIFVPPMGVQAQVSSEVHFSHRHNGLFLYFSRLVRPVWITPAINPGSGTSKENPMTSTVRLEEVEWIMTQLRDFHEFLERNSHLNTVGTGSGGHPYQFPETPGASFMQQHQQKSHQEAVLRERQSLMLLQQLVAQCLQVLGLWKIILEHQIHVLGANLSQDEQSVLRGAYFRDLVISAQGRELCSRLVQALINSYLNGNASTDEISGRLREVCPALYHSEDAISSKAHEMLIQAKSQTNPRERERLLREAVQMCKGIASRINLEVLTSHLASVHCYPGVVEICLAAAGKKDPQNVALHYYKKGEPREDQQGYQAYANRMGAYRHILEMLRRLLDTSSAHPMSPSVPKSPGPPPPPDPNQLPPGEATEHAEAVFQLGLRSDDQLFHVALYQWLIDLGMMERLLSVKSSFLEDFLTRGTKTHPDNLIMFDLLWKYYERSRSYAAAARILAKLADRHSADVNLEQRLEYLSRAIMCVKSGEFGGGPAIDGVSGGVGELLHDLEEKMEVARVQLQIVDALSALPSDNGVSAALGRLNSDLLDISTLYESFAEPYKLYECQLAILHTAGHQDPMMVDTLWGNIVEAELKATENLPLASRTVMLANKIKHLGKLYGASSKYFPMDYIVRKLELFSCQVKAEHGWVFRALSEVNVITLPKLLDVYNRLYLANDPLWLTHGSPNHLLYVLAIILNTFAESPSSVSYKDRRQFTVTCLDAVGQYLSNLYSKHDSNLMVTEFRAIQSKLERL